MNRHDGRISREDAPGATISPRLPSGIGLAVLASLALMGCSTTEPTPPDWATPADARPEWQRWYARAEACAGRNGHVARVHWHTVLPLVWGRFFWYDGRITAGLWIAPNALYLSDALTTDSVTVMHEALHHILQTGQHPAAFDRCGVRYPVSRP